MELMMYHKPSTIRLAKDNFCSYLAKEELQERQYIGRFWDIIQTPYSYILFVLLDDNNVLRISRGQESGGAFSTEEVGDRVEAFGFLPSSLIGKFY